MKKIYLLIAIAVFTSSVVGQTGVLDVGFGNGGMVNTAVNLRWPDLALQSDGKIVTVGTVVTPSYTPQFGLVRYNANGALDSTFGLGGKVLTPRINGAAFVHQASVVVQPDGKILMVGEAFATNSIYLTMFRYLLDGKPDSTFGYNGYDSIIFPAGSGVGDLRAVVKPNGKILLVGIMDSGTSDSSISLIQCNENGSIDSTSATMDLQL